MFSVNNVCKTSFLIGVFRGQFDSSFKQEKALCSQDNTVFNKVLDVCTVVIRFDLTKTTRCSSTKTKMCAPCTVVIQDKDVCTVVI